MNQEIKTQWVAALRSGQYKQTSGTLHRLRDDGSEGYCCLGVLCELAEKAEIVKTAASVQEEGVFAYFGPGAPSPDPEIEPSDSDDYSTTGLPYSVYIWAGLPADDGDSPNDPEVSLRSDGEESLYPLSYFNDVLGTGFAEIANLIEKHL
jgi:hypothetical protein